MPSGDGTTPGGWCLLQFRRMAEQSGARKGGRAVVLLSGGMDSVVCATLAARDYAAAALHIDYGQRTEERERRAFTDICDRLDIHQRLIVRNPLFRVIGGSALT